MGGFDTDSRPDAALTKEPQEGVRAKTLRKVAIVLFAVAAVTTAHMLTPQRYFFLHSAFQHLYYVPIILGAVFFGWPGGLLTAACTAMCYVPHIHRWQETDPNYVLNQYAELGSFFLVGAVTGLLADRERGRTRQLEQKSVELVRANRELENSFEQVKRADRLAAVGQLAAGLAHEIRHPLASIEGAVNVLANPESPSDLQHEFRGIIKKECRRLAGLLKDLLDFAKPRKPKLRKVDMASAVDYVVTLARSSDFASGIEIQTEPLTDLPLVECDEEQIKQVLFNLVMNGAQATPAGGSVTVSARREGPELAVAVSDEGPGVPEDLKSRIFDPFFTTRESGTGLGLAVVQQIMMQHGGGVDVGRSETGGARFTVRIPIQNEGETDARNNPSR